MPLPPPGLPPHARLLELFHLRHAFSIHLPVLPNQPAAQNAAEESHHQTHSSGDPHALAVQRAFRGWEDVGACVGVSRLENKSKTSNEKLEKENLPSKGPHCPTVASTVYPPARLDSVAWIFETQASNSATEAKISTDKKMLK